MEVERVKLGDLKPHPRNPRQGDVGAISESLKAHGQYRPIVAQRSTSYILAGNHTWKAARALKWKDIATVFVDVSDDEAYRILLVDNRSGDLADYDNNELVALLQELTATELGLEGTGYDGDALDELLRDLGMDEDKPDPAPQMDRAAELREQWGTERGQVWAIPSKSVPGKSHRLMCGDSTSAEDVARLMDGEKADMVFTDPPYGMDLDTDFKKVGTPASSTFAPVVGDDVPFDPRPFLALFPDVREQFWWGGDWYYDKLPPGGSWLCWDKQPPEAFAGLGNHFEMCWSRQRHHRSLVRHLWTGYHAHDPNEKRLHPTQKPVRVIAGIMGQHGDVGDCVVDLFAGGGATLLAAENERRVCYGMEIDPGYCAVILQRMTDMGLAPHRVTRDEDNG